MKGLLLGLSLGALGYAAGRADFLAAAQHFLSVQAQNPAPNDPRELFPLVPGPGNEPGQGPQPGQGQRPGQPPGQGQGECPVLLLKDGQLFQLQPGQPNPSQGGQGEGRQGAPGGDGELFPLQPYEGPSPIPGLPNVPNSPFPTDPGVRA